MTDVNRKTKKFVVFFVGDRSSESFERPCKNISHVEAKFYATGKFSVYDNVPPGKYLIGKSHTYTVEHMKYLLQRYLARFARKTHCWFKSLNMIVNSFVLFFVL